MNSVDVGEIGEVHHNLVTTDVLGGGVEGIARHDSAAKGIPSNELLVDGEVLFGVQELFQLKAVKLTDDILSLEQWNSRENTYVDLLLVLLQGNVHDGSLDVL